MNKKIETAIKYYKLCTKLKDTIRTGPIVWNAKREELKSVAEQIMELNVSDYLFIINWALN